jgi:hypothetical protein
VDYFRSYIYWQNDSATDHWNNIEIIFNNEIYTLALY